MTTQPAQPAAPAEQLITLRVDGVELREPMSKVIERAQKSEAVDRRLAEVSRMRTELQAREGTLQREVQFAQYFNAKLAQDPAGLRAELDRMIRLAEGDAGSTAGAAPNSEGTDPASGSHRADPALLRELQELKAQMRQVTTDSTVDRLARDISSELDKYPVFKDQGHPASAEAREQAEYLMRALRASPQGANMSLSDLASQVHARVQKLMTTGTQAKFDSIVATTAAVPAVHAESGTPAIGVNDFQPTVKSFKDEGPTGMRAVLNRLAQRVAPTR